MEICSKKIAFVIPSIEYGGAEIQVINQINYLLNVGADVTLIVIDQIYSLREQIAIVPDKIFELKFPVYQSYAKASLKAPLLIRKIDRILREHQTEVVLANLPFSHYVIRLVSLYSKATAGKQFRLLNYHHSLQFQESPLDNTFKRAFNSINSLIARVTDSANIFISEAAWKDAKDHFFLKEPEVIFNAVPFKTADNTLALQYLNDNNVKPALFNVVLPGRLNAAKGQLFFIDVLKRFSLENNLSADDLLIIFAGGGVLKDEIKIALEQTKLSTFVHITGFIPNELLLSFLQWSDLVLIPSVFEGFGNVALEALMLNKLVLASDAGGLKEIIKENQNGFLFKRLDLNDCLDKLSFLYTYRDIEIISKSKIEEDYQERFSIESHFQKLVHIINTCVELRAL